MKNGNCTMKKTFHFLELLTGRPVCSQGPPVTNSLAWSRHEDKSLSHDGEKRFRSKMPNKFNHLNSRNNFKWKMVMYHFSIEIWLVIFNRFPSQPERIENADKIFKGTRGSFNYVDFNFLAREHSLDNPFSEDMWSRQFFATSITPLYLFDPGLLEAVHGLHLASLFCLMENTQ